VPTTAVLGPDEPLTRLLTRELATGEDGGAGARVVYVPSRSGPDLREAAAAFADLLRDEPSWVVVLSSTEAHEPHHHHTGMVEEARLARRPGMNPRARLWLDLEALAERLVGEMAGVTLTVLRPAPVPLPGAPDPWSRLLSGRLAVTLAGRDPSIQLLAPEDLVAAIRALLAADETAARGTFQVVPAGVVPLRRALRLAGVRRLPVPGWLQRAARGPSLDYLRHSWTASGEAAAQGLGFVPTRTSAEAAAGSQPTFRARGSRSNKPELRGAAGRGPSPALSSRRGSHPAEPLGRLSKSPPTAPAEPLGGLSKPPKPHPAIHATGGGFDDWGMDPAYIARYGRTLFRFLHDVYWRVEVRGLEHVPRAGRAVLAGVHRGFMPFDGVMALYALVTKANRFPRFLIHPSLTKFPFLADFMAKLGGIMACQENGDYILQQDELLGVFPEGIRGAFTMYERAYTLGKFGRDEFVRFALRNRAPLLPFVTVGSAEIYPILGRIDWRWFKRYTEWPFFPVVPAPFPLPSKWHTRFLAPMHIEKEFGPEAAENPRLVHQISLECRQRMQAAIDDMLLRRRSIFFGTIFDDGSKPSPSGATPS
jgi:1-acyl-sn-glycerol-3-phosphate acyltransferase